MAAQRQSAFITITRAGLTAAAALALWRVFAGASWVGPVLLAAVLPAIAFAIADKRRWSAVFPFGASLLGGVWLAFLVDDPSETVAGLPTGSAVSSLLHDLNVAPHTLRSATVPVAPIGSALVLAVVAVLVTALATELIARQLEAPVGAIGPSIALYVAVCALGSHAWAATTACYALVVIAYLIALHSAEVTTRRTWFQSDREHRSQVVAGGAMVGALLVAVAIAFGPLVPGARGAAWINYRSLGNGNGASVLQTTSPLVSVGAKLNSTNPNQEVFTVQASDPRAFKWRVIALDEFVQDDWGLRSDRKSAGSLGGASAIPDTRIVTQKFHIGSIDPLWLPAVYRPIDIDLHGANVLPDSTSLFLQGRPLESLTYTVRSEVANPSAATLNNVTFADLTAKADDTTLPKSFPSQAKSLAEAITKTATTPYAKAAALEDYFLHSGFRYDTKIDLGTGTRALNAFLFTKRAGFCEQFAAAFAELARWLKLPARVAVGYQHGDQSSDGTWHVRERDAHAWPEVWLGPSVGWYAFEPTPGFRDNITGRGDTGAGTAPPGGPTTTTPTTTTNATTPATNPNGKPTTPNTGAVSILPPPKPPSGPSHTGSNVLTALLVVLSLALIGFLLSIAILGMRASSRTRRRRTASDPRRRVLGAWSEALERLAAGGVIRRPSSTSLEFALRQAPAHGAGAAGPPLMELARLHTAALYAPESPSSADAAKAWDDVDAIDAALRTTVSRTTRWKARLRLGREPSERLEREREPDVD